MSEDWQISYWIKGLIAPEKEIVFDDSILVRGVPPSSDACVYFKISKQKEEDMDKLENDCSDALTNILQIYGLVTNKYAEATACGDRDKISSKTPFGSKLEHWTAVLTEKLDEAKRNKNIPLLEKTFTKYKAIKSVFQNKNRAFLKNALDYYYRSLNDDRIEEKLIDLMISLESLFSKNEPELTYRISLRASFFLGVSQESKRPEIFKRICDLYGKRSTVVHGTENVNLDWNEIMWLESHVRDAIKRFIHIEVPTEMLKELKGKGIKQKFLSLLDEAIYDEEKKKILNELLEEAIKKW